MNFTEWVADQDCDGQEEAMMQRAWNVSRRQAFLDASTIVAGHWNDRHMMTNQHDQAQRSAEALQRVALEMK